MERTMKNNQQKTRFGKATDYNVFKHKLMKEKALCISFLHAFTDRNDIVDVTLHSTDSGDHYPVVYECKTTKGDTFIAEVVFSKGAPWTQEQKDDYNRKLCLRHINAQEQGLIDASTQIYHLHFVE
jgi:hypothetical protein